MTIKKVAKKNIRKVEKAIQNLPATPNNITYIRLYQSLQELYFQEEYRLVIDICSALMKK